MADSDQYEVTHELQGESAPPGAAPPAKQPEQIGRYRIEKLLGKGGFGLVYLAHDDQLDRPVAVKVPHAKLISKPEDAEAYLAEARTVANLDHAGIVPVHDVGSTENCPCYVVSKYIEGTDLSTKLKQHQLKYRDAADLVATVAEALHYAHKQGLVHRDLKPGNILVGKDGKPYVVDFGLALREENIGKGPKYAGTPAYMSPEQARGEGHRVDGRSDIFSLGVVLYELLVGRQPFRGDTQAELLEQVTSYEPRPLRQYDEKLPKELERICQKAMAKRASERYSTAHDMAEDLRHFLAKQTVIQSGTSPGGIASVASETHATAAASTSKGSVAASSASAGLGSSNSQLIKIVPKGLRSFDAHDADFFLELLPGPRDREGLPDSLRFWKTRIEEADADSTFSVGLIYGPSGCGKSSLVKAGLLPRLSEDVIPVYVEATPDETEARLLHGLRKRCPALEDNLNLKETLAALRRGQGIPVGTKLLIVLDQFEQWLHTKKEEEDSDLVQALRQCDGGRVQCIVMVRDDFWLAVSRFLRELEVQLVEGENSALADLFDLDHARKVLAAFGRAFGKLPFSLGDANKEQKSFLKESVAGLAEEGKVVCVRLALFAEMMKGKPWTPAKLKEVGGTTGVGVTFLEETFSASTAPPEHRYHQKAARAVLKALLPESGSDIKGEMKSHAELLDASGYGHRPQEFDDLMRILDGEIRLITPTDPAGMDSGDDSVGHAEVGQKYFQLTHDYLVPSLRDWLTRKQKETRRGRAELRLAERSALWNSKPENRHLPAWWEYLNVRLLTTTENWTEPQKQMMRKAGRIHALRWGAALVVLFAMGFFARKYISTQKRQQADLLVENFLTAPAEAFQYALQDLQPLRQYAVPILQERFEDATDPSHRTRAVMALADFGPVHVGMMVDAIEGAHSGAFGDFYAVLKNSPESATGLLRGKAARAEAKGDWQHKARLAIVALHLGDASLAQDMCRLRDDPTQRSVFIDTFPSWREDLTKLKEHVGDVENAGRLELQSAWRSAICLAIGSVADINQEAKANWEPLLWEWYSEPDALTHSAAAWALKQWELEAPEITPQPAEVFDWHVNSAGLTMIRIPFAEFERQDSEYRKTKTQTAKITRDFLLSRCEITVGLFRQFINDAEYPREQKPVDWPGEHKKVSPSPTHPVQQVSWYDAVMFCNWLSWKEGLEPCYTLTARSEHAYEVETIEGVLARTRSWASIRSEHAYEVETIEGASGFRLPTEDEWEFACRAGTTTRFSCGDDAATLDRYCVCSANSNAQTKEVGSRMCNGWGLHDMHGNVWEHTQPANARGGGDIEDPQGPSQGSHRVSRGGCWFHPANFCESSAPYRHAPTDRYATLGFRLARVPSASKKPASGAEAGSR